MNSNKISCILCNNNTDLKFNKSEMDIRYCKRCSLAFVSPQPSVDTQQKYYDKSFREGGYRLYNLSENLRIRLNQKRFNEISKYKPSGNLLDIGCASGYFLDVASQNNLSTFGVELSKEAAQIAKQKHKNIFNGTLEGSNFQNSFFDIVTLFDIIEHVLDPSTTIKEISRIIKPDGLLVITTPDISSWHAKIMGKRWGLITPLEHLFYFSPKSIRILLEKYGFKIEEVRKNYKVFTLDYLFRMAEFFYPTLFKLLLLIKPILPEKILMKEREVYIGEIFVVARKIN